MSDDRAPFLTARWRHLAMLNYEVDPAVLRPFVPAGTELDDFEGRTYASIVGFLFLDTRVKGVAIPFHRDFEEVNLRFYVRRKAPEGWRRAVVFIKEIVPRVAIAWTARALYGENYVALPMAHEIIRNGNADPRSVSYSWWFRGRENRLRLSVRDEGGPGRAGQRRGVHHRALLGLRSTSRRQHDRVPGRAPALARFSGRGIAP